MRYVCAIAVIALHVVSASTNQQHLICKNVEDVFSESSNIQRNDTEKFQPSSCKNCQATALDYARIGRLIDDKVALGKRIKDVACKYITITHRLYTALMQFKYQGNRTTESMTTPPPPPGSRKHLFLIY